MVLGIILFEYTNLNGSISLLGKKYYKNEDILFVIFATILIFMSVIRKDIGTDYLLYQEYYNNVNIKNEENLSFIFFIVMLLFNKIGLPYQLFIALYSLVFLIPIISLTKKINNSYHLFSIAYLVGVGFYGLSYNTFRQYSAMALMYVASYYLCKKNYKKFILFAVLGIGTHSITSLFLLSLIVLYFWKPKKWHIITLTIISTILFLFVPNDIWVKCIVKILNLFKYFDRYKGYAITTNEVFWEGIYNQSAPFIAKMLYFPCLYIIGKMFLDKQYINGNLSKIQELMLKIFYAYILFTGFKLGSDLVTRFMSMFSMTAVWALPTIFEYADHNNTKSTILNVVGVVLLCVLLCYFIKKLYTDISINGGEIYPYKNIFSDIL